MKRFLFIILVLHASGIGYAQDPGIRDTLRFGKWGVYLPCPPCSGIATVPIFVVHDETLEEIRGYLYCSGPVEICTVQYSTEINEPYFEVQSANKSGSKTSVTINLVSLSPPDLPPGARYIGYFVLDVKDSGTASIDTFRPDAPPDPPIRFMTPDFNFIYPSFFMTQFHLTEQNIKPGDANGDSRLNLSDIIYFVNYIFKNGPEPVNKQMADVNVDCVIDLQDLLNVVNYVFKGGPSPLPGCSE